jgi:hypothetical protein
MIAKEKVKDEKDEAVCVHTMKAYRGRRGLVPLILTLVVV